MYHDLTNQTISMPVHRAESELGVDGTRFPRPRATGDQHGSLFSQTCSGHTEFVVLSLVTCFNVVWEMPGG